MRTQSAGIPDNSAVAQQAHHEALTANRKPHPEPAPVAAVAAAKPGSDLGWLRTLGRAIACVLRPHADDDPHPRGSGRRIAVVCAGAAGALALLVRLLRAR